MYKENRTTLTPPSGARISSHQKLLNFVSLSQEIFVHNTKLARNVFVRGDTFLTLSMEHFRDIPF